MKISISQLQYFFSNFRTKKNYLIFQVCQLLLALIIIVFAFTNSNHFKAPHVLWMEFILLLTIAFDLFIVRYFSQGGFKSITKGLLGKIDLAIFILFTITIIFLAFNDDDEEDSLLQTDDIIIILIVISRYAVQIYRMVTAIKQTHETREMNKEIKEIDLNAHENFSTVYQKEIQDQNVLKNRITQKFQNRQTFNLVEENQNN